MNVSELVTFLKPQKIAVVGASKSEQSLSGRLISILLKHDFQGQIIPVNPKYSQINELTCYPDIASIPGQVDMALLAVASKRLLSSLEECGQNGVKNAVVITSGFAETGEEGAELQRQIKQIANNHGMRICGPNCIGVVNIPENVFATFSPAFSLAYLKPGPVGLVGQSGAGAHAVFLMAQDRGIGFSYIISSGNEVDLTAADFLEYMINDSLTGVVTAYLETWRKEEELFRLGELARQNNKPVIVMKVGTSQVGQQAALSHTASMTGSDETYAAAFKKAGFIRAYDTEELIDYMGIFSSGKRMKSNNLAVLTGSGGLGILMADKVEDYGLNLPRLQGKTEEKLSEFIPAFGSTLNPVDTTAQVLADAKMFKECILAIEQDQNIDALIIILTVTSGELAVKFASDIAALQKQSAKPVVVCWCGSEQLSGKAFDLLKNEAVPLYHSPERCVRAIRALVDYSAAAGKEVSLTGRSVENARAREALQIIKSKSSLTEYDAKQVLSLYDIGITREFVVHSANEAVEKARAIGFPVCLKILSPHILHKTESGAILLNLQSEKEVREGYQEVLTSAKKYNPHAKIEGVLVQEMVAEGTQVIVGSNNTEFGPVVLFGLGGIFVEVLKDVTKGIAPLSRDEAYEMVHKIKGIKLLKGYRGEKPSDIEGLVSTLVNVSHLVSDLRNEIAELDINPLYVLPEGKGVRAVDALLIKKEQDS